jgi:hypothetical protein
MPPITVLLHRSDVTVLDSAIAKYSLSSLVRSSSKWWW